MRSVEIIETPALGDRSYLVHDGAAALVVDPQRDIDRIVQLADRLGVGISHVVETHVHNDYVSGGLTLARVTGAIYVHAAAEDLRFDHVGVADGDHFRVGSMEVEVLHTPGHTVHHLSYVVRAHAQPPAVFTGGSLLYGTVGRTDLLGSDLTDTLTRAQFRTAHRLARMLPDDTEVYPTHGFGSFCASAQSEGESDGSLGVEKQINVALVTDDESGFVERLVTGLTAFPAYYAHMGPLNVAGPVPIDLSPPAPVDATELARRLHRGEWVVDLRARRAYAADHVAGTIGIELADSFTTYLGWLIPWGMPLTLLGASVDDVAEAQRQLVRIGLDRPSGALTGPIDSWVDASRRGSYPVATFADLAAMPPDDRPAVIDLRRHDEWDEERLVGAAHVPLHELVARISELPDETVWVHCQSGYRASIGASLIDRSGRSVVLIDEPFSAARAAGLELTSTAMSETTSTAEKSTAERNA